MRCQNVHMTRREWFSIGAIPQSVTGVREHGATGRGGQLESPAIQKAIDSAAAAGGGTVHIPAGDYLCGTLRLRSNVSLWIDNGAVLRMSSRDEDFAPPEKLDYDPQADRATSLFRFALLAGEDVHDIAIHGEGRIECKRDKERGPKPISLKRCRNVAIRGITIERAQSYNISLLGCDDVTIDGVTIREGTSDGIDPDCCRHVRISNCFVESVDDAIVLKASPALGERRATEHVTVTNCVLRTASLFLKCGTESTGDFRNIAFSNCTLIGGMGNRHGNPGIGLYTVDGGTLEGVTISNITMQNVGIPIALRRGARGRGQKVAQPGPLRDVILSNIVATGARRTSVIAGLPEAPIENVTLSGIRITLGTKLDGPARPEDVPEKPADYPDPTMFGSLPASGLYLRHVHGMTMQGVEIRPHAEDTRAALLADDVRDLRGHGVRTGRAWFHNVRGARWLDCECLKDGPAALVSGAGSEAITFRNENGPDPESIRIQPEVRAAAVRAL